MTTTRVNWAVCDGKNLIDKRLWNAEKKVVQIRWWEVEERCWSSITFLEVLFELFFQRVFFPLQCFQFTILHLRIFIIPIFDFRCNSILLSIWKFLLFSFQTFAKCGSCLYPPGGSSVKRGRGLTQYLIQADLTPIYVGTRSSISLIWPTASQVQTEDYSDGDSSNSIPDRVCLINSTWCIG
jgi:hypothetical protein